MVPARRLRDAKRNPLRKLAKSLQRGLVSGFAREALRGLASALEQSLKSGKLESATTMVLELQDQVERLKRAIEASALFRDGNT